jgi:hypothetical protein
MRGTTKRSLPVMAASVLLVLVTASVAFAFLASGDQRVFIGPGNINTDSNGRAIWNGSTNQTTLESNMTNGSSGSCITTYFDWKVSDGQHHDARGLRVCQNLSKNAIWSDVSVVTGMQKLGACYGADDTYGTCKQGTGIDLNIPTNHYVWSTTNPDTVIDSWTWRSNGTWEWNPGGNARRGDS